MSMTHLLFVRDFEAEIDAEILYAQRQAVTHTADDLIIAAAGARTEGHAAGLAEGLASGWAEALASIEAQRLEAMGGLGVAVGALLSDNAAHCQRLEAEMAAFAADLADKVFPELARHLGAHRIDEEIARVMRRAIGSPSLEIRLAPAVAETLATELAAMSLQSGQTIRVVPDAALEPTEVHAAWLHGRSRYFFAAICRSIQTLIRKNAPLPTPPVQAGLTHD